MVIDGKINIQNTVNFPHANGREPRTQFGQKADGSFVLVVTDGRTGLSSRSYSPHEQAEVMLSLGCINAVNVDGGGSSIMVVVKNGKPQIVNQLAEVERAVGSVMIVYKKGWV